MWIGNPTPVVDMMDLRSIRAAFGSCLHAATSEMFVTSSDDNGESWSEPRDITSTAGQKRLELVRGRTGARDSTHARFACGSTYHSVRSS